MKTDKLNQLIAVAAGVAVMLFSACSKDDNMFDMAKSTVPYGPKKQIGVSAQIITGTPDKAYMDLANYKVIWESGDQLTVNNGTLSLDEIDTDDPTHAKFSGSASPNTAIESGKDVYRSVFPASIINSIPNTNAPMVVTLPASQTFSQGASKVDNNFMAAYTSMATGATVDDMSLSFKNLCSVVKMVITPQSGATGVDAQISRIRLASTEGLSGNFNVTFSNGEPVLTAADPTPSNLVELVYSTPLTLSGSTPVTIYAVVPPINNKALVMQIWNGDGSKIIQKQAASLTLGRSRVHTATINQAFEDWGGAISVSNSQRVYFAGGNLQYNFAQDKWRFAHEQWSIVGAAANTQASLTPAQVLAAVNGAPNEKKAFAALEAKYNTIKGLNIWVDYFCWGTSGDNRSGAFNYAPFNTLYGPDYNYLNTAANRNSDEYGFGFGPVDAIGTAKNFSGSESFTGTIWDWNNISHSDNLPHRTDNSSCGTQYADWGVVHRTELDNTIADPSKRGDWRTLSGNEWDYVVNGAKRTEIDGKYKYGLGRIDTTGSGNYQNGVFFIPDRLMWYLMPAGITFTPGMGSSWTTNSYTPAQWAQLEAMGVVFLPAAGARLATPVGVGDLCRYWSSTSWPESTNADGGSITPNAHACSFKVDGNPTIISGSYTQNKFDGNSVRLVRNTTDQ